MNELMTISGVNCYEKDGTAYLRLEDVAWGLGFSKVEEKNGKEYATIRWNRVFGLLDEIGFDHKWSKDAYIPENIFYRLAMKAKNETAEKFQSLVADKIVPSVRKHGAYMTPEMIEQAILNPDTLIRVATELKAERQKRMELEEESRKNRPKALFADAVSASETSILISDLAKLIKQNGPEVGGKRLFEWMRTKGYLVRRPGLEYNMPTQRSMEAGWFEIKEATICHADGHISVSRTPMVTGKGQVYFMNLWIKNWKAEQAEHNQ